MASSAPPTASSSNPCRAPKVLQEQMVNVVSQERLGHTGNPGRLEKQGLVVQRDRRVLQGQGAQKVIKVTQDRPVHRDPPEPLALLAHKAPKGTRATKVTQALPDLQRQR
jgi:hypothetical protein